MAILDQHGKPIAQSTLKTPQTARLATNPSWWTQDQQLAGLSPAWLSQVFASATMGNLSSQAQLFDAMLERDAHLYAEMDKRKSAPTVLNWSVAPPHNPSFQEKKLAAYAEEMLRYLPDFDDIIKGLMDAVGHGFSAMEIAWANSGGEWLPTLYHRPQTWFQLSQDRLHLTLRDGTADGAELQPFGWVLHQHGMAKTGYLGKTPLYRVLAWPFLYKFYGLADFAEFLEIYGLPIIIGKFDKNSATSEDRSDLLKTVKQLSHDARGIMPHDMVIEIQQVSGNGKTGHLDMVDWADKAQSKAILGATLTSQADGKTSTNALGSIHNSVREDIRKADCKQIADTLTRDLIYPILRLNKGSIDNPRRCPRLVFDTSEAEDLVSFADSLPKLVSIGLKIPTSYAYEKLKIPQPEGGEDILSTAPAAKTEPQTAPLSAKVTGFAPVFTPKQQAVEDIGDGLLDNLPSPLSDETIGKAIKAATSPEDLEARLALLLNNADTSQFQDTLSRALFAADVLGYANS